MRSSRMWATAAVMLYLCMVGPLSTAAGQVQPGTRIRVTTDSGSWRSATGTLISMDTDSLRFTSSKDSSTVALSTGAVTRLEQSRGRGSRVGRAALIGAAAGGVTGLVLGLIASGESDSWFTIGPEDVAAAMLFLAGAGAGIGALIGVASTNERWETVPMPAKPMKAAGLSGQVGIRIRL